MSTLNGQEGGLLAALPSAVDAGDVAYAQRATEELRTVLKRLSGAKPVFHSTGFSRLCVTYDGVEHEVVLPIRSVPLETVNRLLAEAYVEPPQPRRTFNKETALYDELPPDLQDPEYQRRLSQANVTFLVRLTLHALNCELEDVHGNVVWRPQGPEQDEAASIAVLHAQGFTQLHYQQIREDVERLSMSQAQRKEQERQKKSSVR